MNAGNPGLNLDALSKKGRFRGGPSEPAFFVVRGHSKTSTLRARPATGFGKISMAPALDSAAAVIILALALFCELFPAPKSLKRTTV